MKKLGRHLIVAILGWQVRRLRKKNHFTIIGVVGSIGKTSTKHAVAQSISTHSRVLYQTGNYNDLVSVPLVFFNQTMPSLLNPVAWVKVIARNESIVHRPYPYDVVVLELGTDGPGQIAAFKKYLRLDLAVLTAITSEHMEYFSDIDAVAKEELSVIQYAAKILINQDLVASEYIQYVSEALTYGIRSEADFSARELAYSSEGMTFNYIHAQQSLTVAIDGFSEPHAYSALAAAAVNSILGHSQDQVIQGLQAIKPVSGRMRRLEGIKNSIIIDDSYNASPEAMKSALDTVYRIEAPQKIVLLGNMNELGSFGPDAHTEIGEYCDPSQLDHVITLGPESNKYLAPAALARGCTVKTFDSPYTAGEYIASIIGENALVLIKGSQNRVYAEESIKSLLCDPKDSQLLVRQSPFWIKKKQIQFA